MSGRCIKCGNWTDINHMKIGFYDMSLCTNCMAALYNELGYRLGITSESSSPSVENIKEKTLIWHVAKCNNQWEIIPMVISACAMHGAIRHIKGCEPQLWNIYAETEYTYLYETFDNLGKTWFLTKEEAKRTVNGKGNKHE